MRVYVFSNSKQEVTGGNVHFVSGDVVDVLKDIKPDSGGIWLVRGADLINQFVKDFNRRIHYHGYTYCALVVFTYLIMKILKLILNYWMLSCTIMVLFNSTMENSPIKFKG
jgi:hypothetical protein